MYQPRKIDINVNNVKIFTEKYSDKYSLAPLVNQVLEKFFSGKLVEVDDHNFKTMSAIAEKLNFTVTKTINNALEAVEWGIDEAPKPRITLDTNGKKIKPAKRTGGKINVVTQF